LDHDQLQRKRRVEEVTHSDATTITAWTRGREEIGDLT
jgi:hypothetical protein